MGSEGRVGVTKGERKEGEWEDVCDWRAVRREALSPGYGVVWGVVVSKGFSTFSGFFKPNESREGRVGIRNSSSERYGAAIDCLKLNGHGCVSHSYQLSDS